MSGNKQVWTDDQLSESVPLTEDGEVRKSLGELFRGVPTIPQIEGIVDVVVRNEDGSIAAHAHKRNMITDLFRHTFVQTQGLMDTNYVFIHQNTEEMHRKRTAMRTVLAGTWAMSVTATKDGPNRLWTFSVVFAAPPVNRTFKTVGLSRNANTGPYTNCKVGPTNIIAATVLGTVLTQLTSQQLEVTYRLAFQRT